MNGGRTAVELARSSLSGVVRHLRKEKEREEIDRIVCGYCQYEGIPFLRWQTFRNGKRHLRAECPECGRYIRWQRQTPANLAEVYRQQEEGRRSES